MKDDFKKLEEELRAMSPAGLDESLADRLEAAMDGSGLETPTELVQLEKQLQMASPAALPDELRESLESVVSGTAFPASEKVVLFPGGSKKVEKPRKWGFRMAAAASVAIAGALAAMMISPQQDQAGSIAQSEESVVDPAPIVRSEIDSGAFVPASYQSGVSDTRDLGVMWPEQARPMRVVRVIYRDQVRYTNDKGQECVIEVPRTEYLLVPEKID